MLKSFLNRFVSSFPPTFKDTNKKANIYAMKTLGLVKRKIDRPMFELPIPGNNARKRGLLTVQNRA
jgi:hypothetical protein